MSLIDIEFIAIEGTHRSKQIHYGLQAAINA